MKSFPFLLALLASGISSSLAQQEAGGVALGPAGPMAPPNYGTKILAAPSRAFTPEELNAPAAITYNVSFADPSGPYSSYYPQLTAALHAAGAEWNRYLVGSGSIEVEIVIDPNIPTENGSSVTNGFVRNDGTRDIYEQGAAYEIRTGNDPNGADPDVRIRVGAAYLTNQLWFDPNPSSRTAAIPAKHIDAISVFTHELGHAFAFTGWANGTTGQLPATYMSTFDMNMTFTGGNLFFVGANAKERYGHPVPLTYNNYGHVGNNSPRPGADLLPDLMNGIVYYYQTRYYVSPIDLDIMRDCGIALNRSAVELRNISTRLGVQTGNEVLIGGFIVTGHAPKRYLLRGIGPSLAASGLSGTLVNPVLELHLPSGAVVTNDNWKSTQQAEIQATGAAPREDLESAILATLAPGSYTAILRGQNNGTGVGLVEAYDLDAALDAQLANISTRGSVSGGENALIGGVIVGPKNAAASKMLIRAIGPSLAKSGVNNPLPDPTLELHNGNGTLLQSNDNWKDRQGAAIEATGAAPTNDKEAAMIATLATGNYTAVVRGKGAATGVCLVEVYNLQ